MIWTIARHEWRLIFREPRFWVPFLFPPLLLIVTQWIVFSNQGDAFGSEDIQGYIMLLLGVMMAPMASPLTADSFAGERERNSLELLLLAPVTAKELFFGKFLAVIPFPLFFALAIQTIFFLFVESITFSIYLKTLLAAISACLLVNGFSLLISLRAKTVRSATQSSIIIIFPLFILVQWGAREYLSNISIPIIAFTISIFAFILFSALAFRCFKRI